MANGIQDVQVIPSSLSNWCQNGRSGITGAAANIRLRRQAEALREVAKIRQTADELEAIARAIA